MKPDDDEKASVKAEKTQRDSDQEMMNLEKELFSLTHYADDEEELVAHMFATIKGSKLEAMMPPILKEIPLIDVQQLCLHELRGMSQRRILSIINGQEMSGSSSDEDPIDEKKSKFVDDNEDSNLGTKSMDEGDAKELNEMEGGGDANLTALDILELEMRAKLIKTMLEKQDDGEEGGDDVEGMLDNGFDPNIKIKEEPLTPDSTSRMDRDEDSASRSPSVRKSRRKRYSRSRSCSSSCSSSYSSRSKSISSNGSRSYSSDRKRSGGSDSPGDKKPTKKKITKKEFEARMKKAKMNRSYRKRKDSEDDSGDGRKRKSKRKSKLKKNLKEEAENSDIPKEEEPPKEEPEEGEQAEEEEVTEKEEGEIDSNEEGAYSSSRSRSRSRSYSTRSYSSYSSRSSRSYSRSPRRRHRKKKKRSKSKRYRSPSKSPIDVPKVPNWKGNKDVAPTSSEDKLENEKTLPSVQERQSISFSLSKKPTPIKGNPELNDDGLPVQNERKIEEPPQTYKEEEAEEDNLSKEEQEEGEPDTTLISNSSVKMVKGTDTSRTSTPDLKPRTDAPCSNLDLTVVPKEPEVVEDFYKGADQLSFSEEEAECENEADLERFLHDDTPVEPIPLEENALRNSVKVVTNKNEPPIASWENKKRSRTKGDTVIEGVGFLKTVLSEGQNPNDSPAEDSIEPQQSEVEVDQLTEDVSQEASALDTLEEISQDAVEPLHEFEAEDTEDSHSLDIIGVIEPKDSENQPEMFEDLEGGGASWSMRWLQSEKVQKVVSNSKMLSKVRKKIQAKGKVITKETTKPTVVKPSLPKPEIKPETTVPKAEPKPSASKSSVIGSIEEYEKLFGIRVKAPTSLPQPKPAPKPVSQVSQAASMFSDDDEDSEEEAIWSKIIKK